MKLIIKSKNNIFKNGAIYNLDNFSIIEPAIKEIDDKRHIFFKVMQVSFVII